MKDDIAQIRDEWQAHLSEKDLELKKQEASEQFRLKNLRSELTLHHQQSSQEQESSYNDRIARLEAERDEIKTNYETQIVTMIPIGEHESILNSELQKS